MEMYSAHANISQFTNVNHFMGGDQNLLLKPKLFLQCTKCSHKFGGQNTQTQIYKKSGPNIYVNYSAPNTSPLTNVY